ncbi:MAG TPA: riboflavin kinase, partial [Acidimicrobiales bacterium]|nr:riboflavin kinase [Acidimicrobiales bacterium]
NVAVPSGLALPAEGIYACFYERPDGTRHPAAVSYGSRPTFEGPDGAPLLEAHLIGFSGDLYGEEARVSFVERLRAEEHFDSVPALVAQMRADVAQAQELLAAEAD